MGGDRSAPWRTCWPWRSRAHPNNAQAGQSKQQGLRAQAPQQDFRAEHDGGTTLCGTVWGASLAVYPQRQDWGGRSEGPRRLATGHPRGR